MEIRKKFKKFGGEFIPDIVEYLKDRIEKDPSITISVGCDSIQKKRKTIYAITIMFYNTDIKNGAHIVFFRESLSKIRDNNSRLQKECDYALEVATFLEKELDGFYTRKDLSDIERKKYKYHIAKCNGEYLDIPSHIEDDVIRNIMLSESEKSFDYRLVDLHLDFNPVDGRSTKRGYSKNKSNLPYNINVPWLRGIGYRVWSKPKAYAASSAADSLLD